MGKEEKQEEEIEENYEKKHVEGQTKEIAYNVVGFFITLAC